MDNRIDTGCDDDHMPGTAEQWRAAIEAPRTDAGLVERLTIDETIRFMETACRNWENFAIKHSDADDMRLALEVFRNQALTEAAARITALDAEVARLQSRWQPIETCPKDGTQFLAMCKFSNETGCLSWTGEAFADHGFQHMTCQPEPTHWMPLPARALGQQP